MKDVFVSGDYMITPLGNGTEAVFDLVRQGVSGISLHHNPEISEVPFYAGILPADPGGYIKGPEKYTPLEEKFIFCISRLVEEQNIPCDEETLVLLSTTKGNISLLHRPEALALGYPPDRIYLPAMAAAIGRFFKFKEPPLVLSNACISGSLAIAVARQLIQTGRYKRAVVAGGDEVSRFIFAGFESFHALSPEPCRPFDRDRKGINLGEAVVAVYLTTEPHKHSVRIMGTGSSNDANHISGPSRTGEGLYRSIDQAMEEAGRPSLDFISAHGTATQYNDDMESVALDRCGLNHLPVHSMKGYFGHTLGASGLLETVLSIQSLKNGLLVASAGYAHPGTASPLQVVRENRQGDLKRFIKTASGFGGCNIATVFEKTEV